MLYAGPLTATYLEQEVEVALISHVVVQVIL